MSTNFYKYEIYSKLQKLIKYLQVLKSRHYSNETPVRLITDLQKLLQVVEKNLDSVLSVHLPQLNNFLENDFLMLCSFIEKSTPSYVPWSLIAELEEISKELISPNESVIIRAENNFNYSIHVVDIITEYLRVLKSFVGDIEELDENKYIKPRIFTIPLLEKNNILLHSILFHEIGHFYEKKFSGSAEIKTIINETIAALIEEGDSSWLLIAGQSIKTLKGFIREIYSDIFALYYCGLPMLFSQYHFHKAYPEPSLPSADNEYYPPMKYRMRIINQICIDEKIYEHLEKLNHDAYKALLSASEEIGKVLENKNDLGVLHSKEYSLIATKAFDKIINKIIIHVKENIKPSLHDLKDINNLFDKLIEHIPPCEIDGEPQNIMKILTSGWAAYFHYSIENDNISDNYKNIYTLNLLCLKALTQSFFFRKFLKAKDGNLNS